MWEKTQTCNKSCWAAQWAPHLLPRGSTSAPAEPGLHSPLCLLLLQEEPPLHSCYMGPSCYTNFCGMIAILLPGASACLGMNKAEKLQYSPSPTSLTCRDPVSETLQLMLWPQFCHRQERAALLNHSKTNLNMHPLFNPFLCIPHSRFKYYSMFCIFAKTMSYLAAITALWYHKGYNSFKSSGTHTN